MLKAPRACRLSAPAYALPQVAQIKNLAAKRVAALRCCSHATGQLGQLRRNPEPSWHSGADFHDLSKRRAGCGILGPRNLEPLQPLAQRHPATSLDV